MLPPPAPASCSVPIGLAAAAPPGRQAPPEAQPLLNAPSYSGEAMAEAGEGEGQGEGERAALQRQASAPAGPGEAGDEPPSFPLAGGAPALQALPSWQGSKSERQSQARNLQGGHSVGSSRPALGRLTGKSSGLSTAASRGSTAGHAAQLEGEGYSWRSTIPATAACAACLFVQKAVQQG